MKYAKALKAALVQRVFLELSVLQALKEHKGKWGRKDKLALEAPQDPQEDKEFSGLMGPQALMDHEGLQDLLGQPAQ
jgi:hypothetical protein